MNNIGGLGKVPKMKNREGTIIRHSRVQGYYLVYWTKFCCPDIQRKYVMPCRPNILVTYMPCASDHMTGMLRAIDSWALRHTADIGSSHVQMSDVMRDSISRFVAHNLTNRLEYWLWITCLFNFLCNADFLYLNLHVHNDF